MTPRRVEMGCSRRLRRRQPGGAWGEWQRCHRTEWVHPDTIRVTCARCAMFLALSAKTGKKVQVRIAAWKAKHYADGSRRRIGRSA